MPRDEYLMPTLTCCGVEVVLEPASAREDREVIAGRCPTCQTYYVLEMQDEEAGDGDADDEGREGAGGRA